MRNNISILLIGRRTGEESILESNGRLQLIDMTFRYGFDTIISDKLIPQSVRLK